MDHRANVYSPLQNIAVWVTAWLVGEVSFDECADAMRELSGKQWLSGSVPEAPGNELEVLKEIRRCAAPILEEVTGQPFLSLTLSGPGDAPGLRANSDSARAAILSEIGALIIPGTDSFRNHVFVPCPTNVGFKWSVFNEQDPLPAPAFLSPGEADMLLAEATRQAADLIEAQGFSAANRSTLPNPRLTVGTLTDFYDTPGLPFCTPPRAAKLFARADRVAAIIETVTTHVDDHSLDPYLFPLTRNIRLARMSGVHYAAMELCR